MIKFRCTCCHHIIRCPKGYAGKVIRCPACKDMTFVPPSVDEVEAALAQARREPLGDTTPPPTESVPHAGGQFLAARLRRGGLRPHHYSWLKFLASVYIALGAVGLLLYVIWIFMQLHKSFSAQSAGYIYSSTDIFLGCFWVVLGLIATTSLFAIGQVVFAFRDMVQNSWITREMVALQRTVGRA